jgi:hypothetical protein
MDACDATVIHRPEDGKVKITDGADPYQAASMILRRDSRFGISDSAWSAHLLGLQQLERLAAAGSAADETYLEVVELSSQGRLDTEVAARPGPSALGARSRAG